MSALLAVARRPDLWATAVVSAWCLRRRRWWARPPFLPIPDPAYVRFRAVTAYGDADRTPDADDVVEWLEWCRSERRRNRTGRNRARG